MRRRQYLAALGSTAVAIGSGCSSPQHGDVVRFQNGSFEQGLDYWQTGTELPEDPNTGNPVVHNFAHSPAHASDGAWSVELFIDGRQDDGTLWVQQQADLSDVDTPCVRRLQPRAIVQHDHEDRRVRRAESIEIAHGA